MKLAFLFLLSALPFLSCGSVEKQPSQDEQNLALLQQNVASSDLFLVEGKKQLAVQKFQKAEQKIRESKAIEAPFYLALALQAQQKTAEAETLFQQAINTKIFVAESCYNLAMIAHHKGDNEQALHMAKKAVGADKTHAGAHFILGSFAFDKSDFDTALAHFQIITEVAPDKEAGWSGVVNVLSLQHKWQKIWDKKERLMEFPSLVIFVAQAAEQTGKQKEAITLLQKRKMNLVVALQYIVLLSQSGDATEALATAHALQKQSPGIILVDRDRISRMLLFLDPEGKLMFVCGKSEPTQLSLNGEGQFIDAELKVIGKRSELITMCSKPSSQHSPE